MRVDQQADRSVWARLDACRLLLDRLPVPGTGATLERWRAFAQIGREDLSLTRLAEGHADARAILLELGRSDLLDCGRLGVWAAEPGRLWAEPTPTGWRLTGTKRWCSGSLALDGALITATAPDGPRLFLVSPVDPSVSVEVGSWRPLGMVATCSETLRFEALTLTSDAAIGGPAAYVERPGFGHGGAGVAACWWGGAQGVVDGLRHAVSADVDDEVAVALGAASADLEAAWSCLATAATEIDDCPHELAVAVRIAGRVRLAVEGAARRVLHLTVESLGSDGLCHDPQHAGRVADLTVYLSQLQRHSAAAAYGRIVAGDDVRTCG